MNNDIWKDVPGYDGVYQVSTYGEIRRSSVVVHTHNQYASYDKLLPPRLLRGHTGRDGYVTVELSGGKRHRVHCLVLLAFVGPCPPAMYARHLDGNPGNNALSNLQWATPTENNRDKIKHGTITNGSDVNTSKLGAEQIIRIRQIMGAPIGFGRKRRKRGTVSALAKEYGVSTATLYAIHDGNTWKHL